MQCFMCVLVICDVAALLECPLGSGPLGGVCVKCPAGSYGVGGPVPCYACEKGWYSPVKESKECTLCPYGSTSPDAGMSSCSACFVGYGKVSPGDPTCTQCAAGSFQDTFANTLCQACPAGTYQPNKGGGMCYSCVDASSYTQTSNVCCMGVCTKVMDAIPPPTFMQRVNPYWVQDPRKLPWYVIPIEGYQTASTGVLLPFPVNHTINNASIVKTSAGMNHTGGAGAYAVGVVIIVLSFTLRHI